MKETEIAAGRDRLIREKSVTECNRFVDDNTQLQQEIVDLKKQLEQVHHVCKSRVQVT